VALVNKPRIAGKAKVIDIGTSSSEDEAQVVTVTATKARSPRRRLAKSPQPDEATVMPSGYVDL